MVLGRKIKDGTVGGSIWHQYERSELADFGGEVSRTETTWKV